MTLVAVCLSALFSVAIYRNLPMLSPLLVGGTGAAPGDTGESLMQLPAPQEWSGALMVIFGQVLGVLFLPAFLFGMVFPLALRLAQGARTAAAETAGKLYAANTVGCIVGTILGTFVLVSVFGTRGALLLLAWLLAPLAAWAVFKAVSGRAGRTAVVGLFLVVLAGGSVLAAPAGFYRGLFEQRFGRVIWFSEGVSETVAVCEHPDGSKWVHFSDGRGNSGDVSFYGGWLYAHLPLLLHRDPHW